MPRVKPVKAVTQSKVGPDVLKAGSVDDVTLCYRVMSHSSDKETRRYYAGSIQIGYVVIHQGAVNSYQLLSEVRVPKEFKSIQEYEARLLELLSGSP